MPVMERNTTAYGKDVREELDDKENYSPHRTFRRTAEGKTRVANLDSGDQNAKNRWRKIEVAKGKRPRFNIVEH